ncbi:hypothetical protein EYF80_063614 [Liparis tanakae]|uniref:Uncharacterized protein n=1 Tax=Liparis tanakae TaxID=230148 RepID=A0A4Z2EBQ1_9TELE|nr:hypothetical protein EYF80_063614 [Liparis tanakae]
MKDREKKSNVFKTSRGDGKKKAPTGHKSAARRLIKEALGWIGMWRVIAAACQRPRDATKTAWRANPRRREGNQGRRNETGSAGRRERGEERREEGTRRGGGEPAGRGWQ